MLEGESTIGRIVARVRCMTTKDWLGKAGKRFRQTTNVISDFSEEFHLGEKTEALHDLGWKAVSGVAQEKHAAALKSYSEEEKNKLESELKRRTMESQARQSEATADKMESDARVAQMNEMNARLELFDKLKARNAIPVWDDKGNMTVHKVGVDFDWDGLQDRFLKTGELPKLMAEPQSATTSE